NVMLAAEPRLALDGGRDGLDLIRALLDDAPRLLAPGGAIGLEIDPSQPAAVIASAQRTFPEATITILPDLAGLDRHVIIETDGSS
ncbi:MAG: peptide chain release factor N(5)-glutamine methyltransferase, partial [Thermomicrobiales bacterium]